MAKHGVLAETDNFIPKAVNRAGIATVNIDGGAVIVEGTPHATEDELYNIAFPTSATVKKVAIAYNPSVKYDVIGGNKYPAKSLDDRNYTNVAGDVVDYFEPFVGLEFGIQGANIEGSTMPTVGKFLEVTANKGTFTVKSSQTADVPSFEVIKIKSANYPTGDFGSDAEPIYIVKTRYNG